MNCSSEVRKFDFACYSVKQSMVVLWNVSKNILIKLIHPLGKLRMNYSTDLKCVQALKTTLASVKVFGTNLFASSIISLQQQLDAWLPHFTHTDTHTKH